MTGADDVANILRPKELTRIQHLSVLAGTIGLAALAVLAVVSFVLQANQARDALKARADTAASASRRIDLLQQQIADLEADLRNTSSSASAERADLVARIDALSAQITSLGAQPVVTVPPTTTTTRAATTTSAASTTTTRPPTSPPTTATPATTTTTGRPCTTAGPVRICP